MKCVVSVIALAAMASHVTHTEALDVPTRIPDEFTFDRYELCGVDIVGYDITRAVAENPDMCALVMDTGACSGKACGAATWSPYQEGTCWMKKIPSTLSATSMLPNANAASYIVMATSTYSVRTVSTKDGVDMVGYDLPSTRRVKSDLCLADCAAIANCYAYTWTNYESGACWLKSRASAFVPKAGAVSVFVGRPYNKEKPKNRCPRLA